MKNKLLKILLSFTFAVSILGTGLFFVKTVSAEVTGAEWATGNDQVSVTMNYDITNSNYGETGENPGYWRIRLADSNTLTSYNNALKAEDFWYKTSYMNLKPMFYETVADAENPSINLGYYEDDFKTTSTPVQSIVSNSMQACDYYGIIYTFTDLETGNYFSVKMYNTASNVPNAKIAISVNGGAYEGETNLTGSFTGRFNGTKGSAQTGVFYLLNLKYDQDENKVKFFRDLSSSFDLSTYGLDSAFETYKVDLSFDRIQAGKTAKLCVYYLNGYDLTATTDVSNLASNGTVVYQKSAAYDCAEDSKVTLTDVVGCWDTAVGDISNQLSYSVKDAQGNDVAVEEGYFTAKSGEYTVTASYGEISKIFTVDVNVPKLATAEWATGNDQVSVTMNFDVANSEYAWWAFSQYDSNLCVSNNNAALKEAGMWYKTNYVGLKPMLYTAPKLASGNPTINLGYYDGDFKMTSSPANSAQKNDASKIDFYGVEYKFTDLLTGDYFTVRAESTYNAPNAKVTVTVNGDTANAQSATIAFSFISRTNGGWNTTSGNLNPFSLKYDTEANAIVTNRNMSTSLSLAAAGLTEALDTYTVDMSFVTYRLDTAKLLVYSLNDMDLCGQNLGSLGEWKNTIIAQKQEEMTISDGSKLKMEDMFFAWDAIQGDVTDKIVYTVKDPKGETLSVADGELELTTTGVYTITCSVGSVEKTMTAILGNHIVEVDQLCAEFLQGDTIDYTQMIGVSDSVDGDILDYATITLYAPNGEVFNGDTFTMVGEYRLVCQVQDYKGITLEEEYTVVVKAPATAEWATGNDQVSATMNFDVANSEYAWWAFSQYDSNLCVSQNNAALKEAGMWYKNDYRDLKPMLYTASKLEEGDPTINLGYYDGDFKMTSSPANSAQKNDASLIDFHGVEYKFTDLLTGEYFTVRAESSYNAPNAKVTVTVNGDVENAQSATIAFSFIARTNGGWNTTSGNLNPFSLKYDTEANAIVTNRNMSTSFSLAAAGLTEALSTYKVDMSFIGYRLDTAKLLVYSLNDMDLCGQNLGSLGEWKNTIIAQKQEEMTISDGSKLKMEDMFFAWDAIQGDVTDQIVYTVKDPKGETLSVVDGELELTTTGVYTITCSVGSVEKTMTAILGNHIVEVDQLCAEFLQGDTIDYTQMIGVSDSVDGDILDYATITLYAPNGEVFSGNTFTMVGEYRLVCQVQDYKGISLEKEYTIFVGNPAQEWATGNDVVNVTQNYDITKSIYGDNLSTEAGEEVAGGSWRLREYDSNMLQPYTAALKAENFWTKSSYVNLKPMFYETVTNVQDPSIKLGYYADDFGMAFTPVQSITANTYDANVNLDYYGVLYTFTDIISGDYFQIKIYNATNTDKNAKIAISVNGGEYGTAQTYHGSFGGRFNGASNSPESGVFYIMNIKYDLVENKIKYNRDLGNSFDLSNFGLNAFSAYTVDMEFYGLQEGKTAKLCVYYLNGYDLTQELRGQEIGSQILVKGEIPAEKFCGQTITLPEVTVWDAVDGDLLTAALSTKVIAPDNTVVEVVENSFVVTQEGVYTVEYSVLSQTNGVTTIKTYLINVYNGIPYAEIVLSEDLPTEFGLGGTLALPLANFIFQGEKVSGWIVVEFNGKIVASFADCTISNLFTFNEKGFYRISYAYESKYGYINAYSYVVEIVEKLVMVNPNLPNTLVHGSENYISANGTAKMGDREYEATLEIISPSGEQVTLDAEGLFKAEEIGEYSFIYRAQADGQSLEETYIVNVEYSSENLFVPNASVSAVIENVDAKYVLQKGSNGVAVVASTGGEVRYANVVDLSALGKETPIIEFQPLTSSDGYLNIRTVIVTLTDIHDETNLVKIKWTLNIDSFVYTYLSVNAGGNGYYALRYPDGHVFKDKYGTNTGCSFYVDQYEPQALSNIRMDFENNAFYAYNGQYIPIIDSDDIKQVGDGYQWKGFTTGEVYVSVSLPDATNGGVIITSIAGQSLAGTKIVDETAPSIVINAEAEYLQQGMPEGVVGMEYPIPTAVSRDLLATNSKLLFRVEYENVESGEREEIPLENGVFIPKKQGTYKLVWIATDMVGNQGKIELPVTVNDTPNDITVDFSKEIADVFVGDKAYIPAIRANGGNGKLSYAVEWAFNGQKIDFTAPAFYRATEKGTLTAKVVVTDYIGNVKTQNLTVEINTPELPVLKVLDVPSSVVKGAILTLPDFTAIDYNYEANENAYQAERKLFINEEELDLTARTYTVTQEKGSVLTVRYVATGKNGDSEKIYFVQVIEPQYIGDYLIYDNSKVTCSLNDAYTEFAATEDFTVSMPNPVSVQDMILCFYVDENHMANGGTVSVWMTDSNDSSIQLKMTITQMDNGKMGIYLNENTEKTMPLTLKADGAVYFAFNSFAKQISDSQGKKILGVEYDINGFEFEGFESGGAYIAFTVNNLSQTQEGENEEMLSSTFFRLNQVGNQRFVTMYFNGEAQTYVDRIAPQLSHSFSMSSKTVKLGDTIAVASAKAFDVLQNQATVTVTVESPTKVLYSNVAIDEDLFFTAEEYGYYSITYTVKSGVRTDKLPSYFIKVRDETPPTIQVNGKVQESCKVGKTLVLPKATIGDDSTDVEMLQFFVFVIEPNGRYIDVTENLQYQVTKAGRYTVVYYLVDGDYNTARQEYVVVAR